MLGTVDETQPARLDPPVTSISAGDGSVYAVDAQGAGMRALFRAGQDVLVPRAVSWPLERPLDLDRRFVEHRAEQVLRWGAGVGLRIKQFGSDGRAWR